MSHGSLCPAGTVIVLEKPSPAFHEGRRVVLRMGASPAQAPARPLTTTTSWHIVCYSMVRYSYVAYYCMVPPLVIEKQTPGGGNCGQRTPPPKKLRENCGKLAVLVKRSCGQDLENFGFPDSGHQNPASLTGSLVDPFFSNV